jgi:hypothetical protein
MTLRFRLHRRRVADVWSILRQCVSVRLRRDWRQYRSQLNLSESDEINLHFGKRDPSSMSYEEAMAGVTNLSS